MSKQKNKSFGQCEAQMQDYLSPSNITLASVGSVLRLPRRHFTNDANRHI